MRGCNIDAQQFRRLLEEYARISQCLVGTDHKEELYFYTGGDPVAFSHHYFLLRLVPRLRSKTRFYLWGLIIGRIHRLWLMLTIPYVRKIRRGEPKIDVTLVKDLIKSADTEGLQQYLRSHSVISDYSDYYRWIDLAKTPSNVTFDRYLNELLDEARSTVRCDYLNDPIEFKILNDLGLLFLR